MRCLIMRTALAAFFAVTAHSQVTNARLTPFVVHKHEEHYAADPKFSPYLSDSMYARRSDGSWRHAFSAEAPSHDRSAAQMIEFLDFRTRTEVILEPFTGSAIIFHLSDEEAREEREPVTDCSAVPVSVNRIRILSYDVTRVVTKVRITPEASLKWRSESHLTPFLRSRRNIWPDRLDNWKSSTNCCSARPSGASRPPPTFSSTTNAVST